MIHRFFITNGSKQGVVTLDEDAMMILSLPIALDNDDRGNITSLLKAVQHARGLHWQMIRDLRVTHHDSYQEPPHAG